MRTVKPLLTRDSLDKSGKSYFFIGMVMCLIAVFTLVFLANVFVFFNVRVSGESMEKTLYDGDMLIVNRWRAPSHGDIVIIDQSTATRKDYWIIKRVIGMGGDEVKISDGKVYLKKSGESDFSLLNEPYAYGETTIEYGVRERLWVLEEDQIFFMGDNRKNSTDSRSSYFGPCRYSQILGVVSEYSVRTKGVRNFIYGLRVGCFGG